MEGTRVLVGVLVGVGGSGVLVGVLVGVGGRGVLVAVGSGIVPASKGRARLGTVEKAK